MVEEAGRFLWLVVSSRSSLSLARKPPQAFLPLWLIFDCQPSPSPAPTSEDATVTSDAASLGCFPPRPSLPFPHDKACAVRPVPGNSNSISISISIRTRRRARARSRGRGARPRRAPPRRSLSRAVSASSAPAAAPAVAGAAAPAAGREEHLGRLQVG